MGPSDLLKITNFWVPGHKHQYQLVELQSNMNVNRRFTSQKRVIIFNIFSMTPSEGENELLSQKGQSFQKLHFGKRKSL